MCFTNKAFQRAAALKQGFFCRRNLLTIVQKPGVARANAGVLSPQAPHAHWVLVEGKLRMVWTCESESEGVPLARAVPFSAIFIFVRGQYGVSFGAGEAVVALGDKPRLKCAA